MCSSHDVALYSTPTFDARLQEVIEATKKDNTAVTETNCAVRMARKKNTSTERSSRILERQGQNIQNKWFNHERGTVGNTYWLTDRDAETNTHGPHGDSKVFPACQGTDVLARHVQSQCDMCQEYRGSNQKEPTIPGPTPKHPWEEIATDLFHWSDHDYLIIVDYFSRYIELCKPEDTSSTSIITHTTSVLAQHGIPMVIRSDNGTQYTAEEYKRFTKEWGIQHVTTSPYHTQANGLAEKSVQIIKSLLNKSKANNQDPYLSLLEYRNTTVDNVGSPAQLLMGRKLRATLLVTASQLKQKNHPLRGSAAHTNAKALHSKVVS